MPDIQTALKNTGVVPPQNKRIWLWLKDHPDKTATEVATALKLPNGTAGSQLSQMRDRGMVVAKAFVGSAQRYSTTPGMEEFELLPKGRPLSRLPGPAKATADMPAPHVFDPRRFLSKLTLAELEAVYEFTRRLFK